MKIAFLEVGSVRADEKESYMEVFGTKEVSFFPGNLSGKHLSELKDIEVLSVFTTSAITREVIMKLPHLQFIQTRSTGYNHIDIAAASERSIKVCNVPHYGDVTVAEYTFALLFSLARHLGVIGERIKKRDFSFRDVEGFELAGKKLGVVGTGRIGKKVVRIARSLGMNVLLYDVYPDEQFAREFDSAYVPLTTLLRDSDILTLHAPSTAETHHLLREERFKMMKKRVVIVNTSRGELIHTGDLVRALNNGIVSAAALDVVENETMLLKENLTADEKKMQKELLSLIAHPHVVFTPHMAYYSKEATSRIVATTIETLQGFISGTKERYLQCLIS